MCLSIGVPVDRRARLSACPSVGMPVCRRARLSISVSVLSVCLSVGLKNAGSHFSFCSLCLFAVMVPRVTEERTILTPTQMSTGETLYII